MFCSVLVRYLFVSLLNPHGIMCHRRYSKRVRRFTALLAFLVGISIGFLLTARSRVSLVSSAGIVLSSTVLGCNTNSDTRLQAAVEGRFAAFLQASRLNSSLPVAASAPVGPNERVLRLLQDGVGPRKNLILIGVMTAQKYLDTRAVAVYRTWARDLPGHVVFFTCASARAPPELPVVRLAGVDDTYPPQKKSFLMLKYMYDNFLDKFEWFMRADDDVYVRGNLLERLLRSVNGSRPQFIGQAGMGNKEEFGQLNLDYNENFCMGGPGIVFSRQTLKLVAPHVKECLKNLYSTHEDVEVGRCVRQFAAIPCTWSYEMQNIFYHNGSESAAFTGSLKQKEVHRAITLHPVKQHGYLYRMHNYMQALHIEDLKQRALTLHRDLSAAMEALNRVSGQPHKLKSFLVDDAESVAERHRGNTTELGKAPCLNKFFPGRDFEVLKWDFIQRTWYSHTNSNPRRRIEQPFRETLDDLVVQIMEMINKFSKQRGRVIDFKDILYGYQRVNPHHGADYILDLLLVYKKYRGRKMTIPVRKHVYLQQAFTELELRELPPSNVFEGPGPVQQEPGGDLSQRRLLDKRVNFVLPLAGRFATFQRFIDNFEKVCLSKGDKVSLTVVLFPTSSNSAELEPDTKQSSIDIAALVHNLQSRYPNYYLKVVRQDGTFSRALALENGAAALGPDEMLFFVDVDMHFDERFLQRVRLNTIRGQQVYFPIVFSQFDPRAASEVDDGDVSHSSAPRKSSAADDQFAISDELGYWRQFGFGIVSLYNSDLKAIGGLDTTIQGWGREDVDLYDKIVQSNLTVFRAADPGLVHIFHPIECDQSLVLSQLDMCLGSRASSYASTTRLAQIIYNNPDILKFARADKTVPIDVENVT